MVERITSISKFNDEVPGSIPGSGILFFSIIFSKNHSYLSSEKTFGGCVDWHEVYNNMAWCPIS